MKSGYKPIRNPVKIFQILTRSIYIQYVNLSDIYAISTPLTNARADSAVLNVCVFVCLCMFVLVAPSI